MTKFIITNLDVVLLRFMYLGDRILQANDISSLPCKLFLFLNEGLMHDFHDLKHN